MYFPLEQFLLYHAAGELMYMYAFPILLSAETGTYSSMRQLSIEFKRVESIYIFSFSSDDSVSYHHFGYLDALSHSTNLKYPYMKPLQSV